MTTSITYLLGSLMPNLNITARKENVNDPTAGATFTDIPVAQILIDNAIQFDVDGSVFKKANQVYAERITLHNGSGLQLDLTGGTLLNPFGDEIAFDRIYAVYIKSSSLTDSSYAPVIEIGSADADEFLGWFGTAGDTETLNVGGVSYHTDSEVGWECISPNYITLTNTSSGYEGIVDVVILGDEV